MELQDLEKIKTDEWIETLDLFQQNLIKDLLKDNTEEAAIEIWINATGSEYTAMFGGTNQKDFLKNIKTEFDKFVLGDDKYKDDIKELKEHVTVTKYFVVSFLSTVLSKHLGVAATVVAPLIVLFLSLVSKMGINAYIESIKQEK